MLIFEEINQVAWIKQFSSEDEVYNRFSSKSSTVFKLDKFQYVFLLISETNETFFVVEIMWRELLSDN